MPTCKKCANHRARNDIPPRLKEYCAEDLWDRNDTDQSDIQSEDGYQHLINEKRICSHYEAV